MKIGDTVRDTWNRSKSQDKTARVVEILDPHWAIIQFPHLSSPTKRNIKYLKEVKVLKMTLKKRWFDLIALGEKREEYREIKGYWGSRLRDLPEKQFREFDEVHFTNGGYNLTPGVNIGQLPFMRVECKDIDIGEVNPKWAPEGINGEFFRIKLGEVVELLNWQCPHCRSKKPGPCVWGFEHKGKQ